MKSHFAGHRARFRHNEVAQAVVATPIDDNPQRITPRNPLRRMLSCLASPLAVLGLGILQLLPNAQALTYANWTFNDGSGTDSSGNGHGLGGGGPTATSPTPWGPSGSCSKNDGSGEYTRYGSVPGTALPTDDFTLGLWVQGASPAYSSGGQSSLLATNGDGSDSLWIGAQGSNWKVSLGAPGGGTLATFAITPSTPQHIEVTREAGSYSVYLDEVLVAGPTAAGGFNWNSFHVGINSGGGTHYRGLFGDVLLTDVVARSPQAMITNFGPGATIGAISSNAAAIAWTVPFGTNPATLAPTFTLSSGATCDRVSGNTYDFNSPVVYHVEASDFGTSGIYTDYTVTVSVAPSPLAPGFPGLVAWYDASTLALSDGDPVTAWSDLSGNGRDLVTFQGTPNFKANVINSRPAVNFENESLQTAVSNPYFAKVVFLVFRSASGNANFGPDWGAPIGVKDGDDSNRTWMFQPGEDRFWDGELPSEVVRNGAAVSSANNFELGADVSQYMVLKVTAGPNNGTQVRDYIVGSRTDGWSNSKFDTAEIIAFDSVLSAGDEGLVGGYLAEKYGLTTAYPAVPLAVSVSVPANGQAYLTGSSVTATAAVIPGAGTGPYEVQFYLKSGAGSFVAQGSPVMGAGPTFDLPLGLLADETYQIYAVITDSTTATATSAINTFTVEPAVPTGTTLATSGSPSTYGDSVTFTATVSPTPSGGTVQFYDDGNPIGSPVAVDTGDGTAQYTTTLLGSPTNSITANYSGHTIYNASIAPEVTQTVDQALLTVTANNTIRSPGTPNPTFTYTITGYKNGEDAGSAGITGNPDLTCSTAPDNSIIEGPFTIDCTTGDLAADNYSFTTVNGVLVVQSGAPPVANNMVCWFDASIGVTVDGSGVLTWDDLSGNGHHATRNGVGPVRALNEINSKPSVQIRTANNQYFNCAGTFFAKEQYVVVRSPNVNWSGDGSFLGRTNGRNSSFNLARNSTGFWQDQYPVTVVKNGYAPAAFPSVVNNNTNRDKNDVFFNGCRFAINDITDFMILKIVVNDNDTSAAAYTIGMNGGLGRADMDIAEIIGYGAALSAGEEQALGFYLEDKYGIPAPNYADVTPQALIVNFSINGLPTRIDQARREITVTAVSPVDISALVPTFTLSDGATCKVNGAPVTSGVTEVNFSPAHYIVTSSDLSKTTDYTVTVDWSAPVAVAVAAPTLDVTVTGTGAEILNDGTLVEANHFGSSLTVLTVNSVVFGTSGDARLTQSPGNSTTNTDQQGRVPLLNDTTDFGKLMRTYRWGGGSPLKLDIPGLTPGHTYRLQWITSSPRGGNISVEGSPSVPQAPVTQPESNYPRVLAFTWVAADPTANVVVTRQSGSYSTDNEILWNAYALHDMGVLMPPAIVSGVTSSSSIPEGTPTVTLGGMVSDGGAVFAANGDVASVAIDGATYYAVISGGAGAFSIEFPTASLPVGEYPITYGYVGNGTTLFAAADETSTTLTVTEAVTGGDYDTWAGPSGYNLTGGIDDDDDGDGLSNRQEYAFGLNPTSGASVSPITVQLDPDGGTFTYTRRDPSLTNLAYSVWTSTDLGTWTLDAGAIEGVITTDLNDVQTVPVTLSETALATAVDGTLFVRVQADDAVAPPAE